MARVKGATEKAYRSIKEGILRGELAPGEPICEEEVASRLGISRTPVQRALRLLEEEGLVESFWRRGTFVRKRTPEEVLELYEVRAVLEGLAARRLAGRASEELIGKLRAMAEEMDGMGEVPDEMELSFHEEIAKNSGSRYLEELLHRLYVQEMVFPLSKLLPRSERPSVRHTEVVEAIASGDGDRAEELAKRHVLEGHI
ncbi:MAG: hypothetical protein DRP99_06740 [Candidatus Latescibacterota bacterium]|nr:MAG: hypothetical protein DRP99_06740 [Candidatus Latescibacterota bacterium]